MLGSEALAARTVAVLVSRQHNAGVYAARGCEDLDAGYRALERLLRKFHIRADAVEEPETLYRELIDKIHSAPSFAAKLDALYAALFPSKFGQLVTFVLAEWDRLPEQPRTLADKGELWIAPATALWTDEFRELMRAEMVRTSRRLYLFTNLWLLRRMARLLDRARLDEARDFPGLAFSAVLDEEMEEIETRRGCASSAATAGPPQERADAAKLTGLAFSGGGIRSATFNLGVLQSLAEAGLLRSFDYLSTVSGGGYIGSWLHAWVRDAGQDGIDHVQECLAPSQVPDPRDERAAPIRFLRNYSNYLTPQTGFLSADTWTLVNIWLRNTFLNVLILALALSAVLLAPRWLASVMDRLDDGHVTDYWWALVIPPACLIGLNLRAFHSRFAHVRSAWFCKEQSILLLIVAPIFLAAWGAGAVVPNDIMHLPAIAAVSQEVVQPGASNGVQEKQREILDSAEMDEIASRASFTFAWVTALMVVLISILGRLDLSFYAGNSARLSWWRIVRAGFGILGVCVMATAVCVALYYLWLRTAVEPLWLSLPESRESRAILTSSPPAFLFALSIAVFLYMGLLGRRLPDDRREWMARLGGWLSICCIGWVALCGAAAYGPHIVIWLAGWAHNKYVGEGGIGALWTLVTAAGVFSAHSAAKGETGSAASIPMSLIAKVAPPVFVGGLLLLLSYALARSGQYDGWPAFFLSLVCGLLALFLSRRVDINEFSLHLFYRNRLVRCYLGGARATGRQPNPFTGFDDGDDFPVHCLAPSRGYSGPYPIFNATLNVSHGEELAWQERKGEAFVFTPRFSGFDVSHGRATHARTAGDRHLSSGGYRPTRDYGDPNSGGVSAGTAVAISGAAASPNQGMQTTAATAFLMTVLDLRLGWWMGNPRHAGAWSKARPGLFQLLAELTGNTSDTGKYVHLSDGGHFENLAVYELIRRRCRYIVACDSEEDHRYAFGGLGNLIRKCRTDFGVEIEIDTAGLTPPGVARFTAEHAVLGKIHYPGESGAGPAEGTLIYIKSSLTGDESADVLQYSAGAPRFPHESTADQWFGEAQFESYRKLGFHVGKSARPLFEVPGVPPPLPPVEAAGLAVSGLANSGIIAEQA